MSTVSPLLFAAGESNALEQQLPAHSILKATGGELINAVQDRVASEPGKAALYVRIALSAGRADADALAPMIVSAALKALGKNPGHSGIADIVRSAVKITPSEVLEIVPAAVRAVPREAAPVVVAAAVSAVPDPQKKVTMEAERRLRPVGEGKDMNDGKGDGKETQDGKALDAGEGREMTLAQAIVEAALEADPELEAQALTHAVDESLITNFAAIGVNGLMTVLAPSTSIVSTIPNTPPTTSGGGKFGSPGGVSP